MEAIVERIMRTGGGLFEERGGRVLVKGTDVDLAEVWEVVNPVPQWPSRADAPHQFMCSRGIDRDLAEALAGYVLKHPVTVEDYYRHAEAVVELTRRQTEGLPDSTKSHTVASGVGKAKTTVYRVPDGNLLDSTKPHWSLDQSLQEARDHINILHKEIGDLKQHIANLQATVCVQLAQSLGVRGAVMEIIRGLAAAGGLSEEKGEAAAREFDETIAGTYRSIEGDFDQLGKIFCPIAPIHPHLADALSIEVWRLQKANKK